MKKQYNYISDFMGNNLSMKQFAKIHVLSNTYNEEKKVQACVVKVEWNDMNPYAEMFPKIFKNEKFIGKATLNDLDTYNEVVGADLAEHRAVKGAYHYIASQIKAAMARINLIQEQFSIWQDMAINGAENQENLINRIIDNIE